MIKKRQKKAITLIEIMIVIFLISLIAGVVGYNMKGSLDKAKAQTTLQAKEKIENILNLELAVNNVSSEEVLKHPENYLRNSGLVKDPEKLLKDGWGEKFTLSMNRSGAIKATSNKLDAYNKKSKQILENTSNEQDEEFY